MQGVQLGAVGGAGLLASEPQSHSTARHWRECMFCQDYSLSQAELQRFSVLREEASVLWEQQPRWELLRTLHQEYFGGELRVEGEHWQRLGFQGRRPETDLRGSGVLGLRALVRFVQRRRGVVEQMERDRAGFFFAITAVNVAFLLKQYLHLDPAAPPRRLCDRRALKNFCRLLLDRDSAFMDLHELLLAHFYSEIWVGAEGESERPTLLRFNELFGRLEERMRGAMEGGELLDFADFEDRWSRLA